jgi:hypothetical protein
MSERMAASTARIYGSIGRGRAALCRLRRGSERGLGPVFRGRPVLDEGLAGDVQILEFIKVGYLSDQSDAH